LTGTGLEVGLASFAVPLTIDGGFILETEANVDAGNLANRAERVAGFP
jgi:hypothetical protein